VAFNAAAAVLLGACSSGDAASSGSASGSTASPTAASAVADYNEHAYEDLRDGGTFTSSGSFSGDDTQGLPWNVNASLTGARLWAWYNPVAITFSPSGAVQINHDCYTDAAAEEVDGKQVVPITINPEAIYNDGTPIDWHSIEQTWKVNNGSASGDQIGDTAGWDQIESVEQGEDDRQAVVTFSEPYTAWPALFSRFINPKAANVDAFNTAYSNQVQPDWGAGPFTIESYDSNSKRLVFTRNDKWWGKTARLDKRIYVDLDSQAQVNAFKNGQIDYTATGTAEGLNEITGVAGTEIRQGGSPFVYSPFVNGKSDLLQDVDTRHAVLAAMDRAQIAQIEFQGLDYSEPLPGSAIYYSFQDGTRLSIDDTLFGDDALDKAVAQSLVASFKKAGIELTIVSTDASQWSSTINEGKFDLLLSANRSLDPYGSFGLAGFYGTGENNITGVGSQELDDKIAAVNRIADPDEQVVQAKRWSGRRSPSTPCSRSSAVPRPME
jgi:peptide/nickel transport system substrate-binding protein